MRERRPLRFLVDWELSVDHPPLCYDPQLVDQLHGWAFELALTEQMRCSVADCEPSMPWHYSRLDWELRGSLSILLLD